MKSRVSKAQYDKIESEARVAKMILEDESFQFVRDYMHNSQESIKEAILKNTIHDVEEEVNMFGKIRRLFTPKKQQIDEMCGQYKWITQFRADLEFFASQKEDIDKAVAKGEVVVEGLKKDVTYVK